MTNAIKLMLFLALALGCVYLGWNGLAADTALALVKRFGLAAIALPSAWLVVALMMSFRSQPLAWRPTRRDALTLVLLLLVGLFIATREPAQFKVMDDEVILSATAMNIHFNRDVTVPGAGYLLGGSYRLIEGYLDKRPLLFPFVF